MSQFVAGDDKPRHYQYDDFPLQSAGTDFYLLFYLVGRLLGAPGFAEPDRPIDVITLFFNQSCQTCEIHLEITNGSPHWGFPLDLKKSINFPG